MRKTDLLDQFARQGRGAKDRNISYQDNSDLFGAELTQLHIGSAKPTRSQTSSIFGESYNGRTGTPFQGPSRFDRSMPIASSSCISSSRPPSTTSGYFGDKQGTTREPPNPYFNNVHQPSLRPYSNYSPPAASYAYHYKSSSVASVFGGQKPLISPSRLAGSHQQQVCPIEYRHYNHHCYCHQNGISMYGAYSMVCGSNMMPLSPTHFNNAEHQYNYVQNPYSKSSSLSSGFISRDAYNGSQGTSSPSPSRFSATPNSDLCEDEPSTLHSPTSNMLGGDLQYRSNERKPNPKIFQRQSITRSPTPTRKLNRTKREIRTSAAEDNLIFSDDDEAKSSVPVKNMRNLSSTKLRRRTPTLSANPEGFKYSRQLLHNLANFFKQVGGYIGNAFAPIRMFQLFLRMFVFINVLMFFCIFFVGKWPDPMNSIVNRAAEFYEQIFGYILPLLLQFESFLNLILSYIIPSGTDDFPDEEMVERILFND